MANRNRLLVLGAGASRDLGFPLGLDLLKQILHKTCPQKKGGTDQYLADLVNKFVLEQGGPYGEDHSLLLNKYFGDIATREKNLLALREVLFNTFEHDDWFQTNQQKIASGAMSIDHYLNEKLEGGREYQDITKYCIAYILMGYESSALQTGAFHKKNEWHSQLWNSYLKAEGGWETSQKKLRVITFNYDRNLEHSLFVKLHDEMVDLGDDAFHGQSFMKENIRHVYGQLGAYSPPYSNLKDDICIYYGSGNKNISRMINASQQIQLMFNERKGEEVDSESAKWVAWANEIFFIGFGFDEANCAKIGVTPEALKGKYCLTTSDSRDTGLNEYGVEKTGKYAKEFTEEWLDLPNL